MKLELQSLLQRNLIAYYGFTGHENLGDEAIWQSTKLLFSQKKLYPIGITKLDIVNHFLGTKKRTYSFLVGVL